MEDILLIQQDLNVSHNYNLSLFAVFDGHGGSECVNYVS
jgi:serine/threonine protein phosphatase PrpC